MTIGKSLLTGLLLTGVSSAEAYTLDCGTSSEPIIQLLCQKVAERLDREGPRANGVSVTLRAELASPIVLNAQLTLIRGQETEHLGPSSLSVLDATHIPPGQISSLVDALFSASAFFRID